MSDQMMTPVGAERRSWLDLSVIFTTCGLIFLLGLKFELFDTMAVWARQQEGWRLEEFLVLLLLTGSGLGVFGLRRLRDMRREIVERQRIEMALKESEQYAKALFDTMQTGMVVIDKDTCMIIDANPAATAMIGATRGEVVGRECHQFICPKERGQCPIIDLGQTVDRSERVLLTVDGAALPILKSVITTTLGGHDYLIETFFDITERKALEERLRQMSVTDELTGLYNRRGFALMADKQIKIAERVQGELYLLYADIDNMKWINDTLGHDVGDQALIETAKLLQSTLRQSDGIGRLGGDEFAMLLTSVTPVAGEHPVIGRLAAKLAARNAKAGHAYPLSLSIGVARFDPERPASLDELLTTADSAMYACKRRRKEEGGEAAAR